MARTHWSSNAHLYRMQLDKPHEVLEPEQQEIRVVDEALKALVEEGILDHQQYDHSKFLAHRKAVADNFEIPWTAISPRMQRMLYAINAISQPKYMIAAGVFCGNTFISNAGAGAGPGTCYQANDLVGVEIVAKEAERAERNVRKIDPTGIAHIVAADAIDVVRDYSHPIDLLYLDADGDERRGKGIYLDILLEALPKLHKGSIVIAHNSINCAVRLATYLNHVRRPQHMRASVNVMLDDQGIEVSVV